MRKLKLGWVSLFKVSQPATARSWGAGTLPPALVSKAGPDPGASVWAGRAAGCALTPGKGLFFFFPIAGWGVFLGGWGMVSVVSPNQAGAQGLGMQV